MSGDIFGARTGALSDGSNRIRQAADAFKDEYEKMFLVVDSLVGSEWSSPAATVIANKIFEQRPNLDAMYQAIKVGTYEKVLVEAPLVSMNKAQVVRTGLDIGVPYHLTWSCYLGKDKQCGKCGTCIDRREAFNENNVTDPVPYEEN